MPDFSRRTKQSDSLVCCRGLDSGSVHQHAIREQLEERKAALVQAAIRFTERFQTEPMSREDKRAWLLMNEEVTYLEAQIAALEGTIAHP